MPSKEYDPYETTSGLPDDFDGVMKNCQFDYRTVTYQDEEVLAFTCDLLYEGEDGPAEHKLIAGVGKGWESTDRGKTIQAADGGKKKVHKQTYYGLLIDAAINDAKAPLREIGDEVEGGAALGPLRAALFEGLEFHWLSKKISYGGEIGDMDRLLPNEYIGRKGAKPKSSSSTKAEKPTADSNGKVSAVLAKKLQTAAEAVVKAGGDHDAFLAAAVEIDGVMDNRAAEDAISATDPESVWGKALAAAE